jgi:hypothetical protein
MKNLTGTVAILLVASTLALAEGDQAGSSGTITKIDAVTGEFAVKDYDGKSYVIKRTDVTAQDLKTGDTVVYEIVASAPANMRKGSTGTVTKIDAVTGEFTVTDREGKTYVVKKTDIVAKDLKTGDGRRL